MLPDPGDLDAIAGEQTDAPAYEETAAHQPTGPSHGFDGGSGIEFVGDPSTSTLQVGPVTVPGMYEYREQAGQNAPSKRTEAGFEFTSRVGTEPIQASFSAWVKPATLQELRALRDSPQPFSVYVKSTRLATCKLSNLEVQEAGGTTGALDISIDVEEIQQAEIGRTELQVTTATGSKSTNPDANHNAERLSVGKPVDDGPTKEEKTKQGWLDFFRGPSNWKQEQIKQREQAATQE